MYVIATLMCITYTILITCKQCKHAFASGRSNHQLVLYMIKELLFIMQKNLRMSTNITSSFILSDMYTLIHDCCFFSHIIKIKTNLLCE